MKRLGMFSGNIYTVEEFYTVEECCVCLSEEMENDKEFLEQLKTTNKVKCLSCFGCPKSIE